MLARQLVELRARIGDGDEVGARLVADDILELGVKILEVRERLDCAAGLRGDDEQRARQLDRTLDIENRLWISRIQHQQIGQALRHAKRAPQHLWRQTAAAHAEQHGMCESGSARVFAQVVQSWQHVVHLLGNREPAQSVGNLVLLRRIRLPECGIFLPDAPGELLPAGAVQRGVYDGLERAEL